MLVVFCVGWIGVEYSVGSMIWIYIVGVIIFYGVWVYLVVYKVLDVRNLLEDCVE